MSEMADLPQELLIEIFSRLPTKSVGKCKCLSRSWNSNLSTQEFIKLHLTRKPHQENLILISRFHFLHTISHPIQTNGLVSKKIELLNNNWTGVVGSCNGLVLLVNKDDELWLINPVTTQKVKIPHFDLALNKDEGKGKHLYQTHGFGYDSCSDDYKIVTLSYYYDNTDIVLYNPDCIDTFVDVYSVKTNVWKRVDSSSTYVPLTAIGVFVNGAIHWLTCNRESYIDVVAVFDLSTELFGEIPTLGTLDNFDYSSLAVLGGRLWIVNISIDNNAMEVWAMGEYGLVETWMKLLVHSENDVWDGVKPLCYSGEDAILLANDTLVVFNMSKGTHRDMIVDGVWATSLIDAGMFVDSLVAVG